MKKLSELGISPAPWLNEDDYIVAEDGTPVARMVTGGRYDADTRMVKATPYLYEALWYIYQWIDVTRINRTAGQLLHNALEKASGESEVVK